MAPSSSTAVYLEVGARRTFACAVEWPGWCRAARDEGAALEALAAYAPRYARVADRAGIALPAGSATHLEPVETVLGNATTDFGAPGALAAVDLRPLDASSAARHMALLDGAWEEFQVVAAGAPAQLTRGPRGGGRDRDGIVAHVVEAERSYARKVGVRLTATEWSEGRASLMRERLRDRLGRPSDGAARDSRGWPVRYAARRIAWHVLDHAWEIEDRTP